MKTMLCFIIATLMSIFCMKYILFLLVFFLMLLKIFLLYHVCYMDLSMVFLWAG